MKNIVLFFFLILSINAFAGPKYGPNADPLSKKTHLTYFQKNGAPDFWALIPYYLPQPTGRACTASGLTLVLNGARSEMNLTSDDKLLTIEGFVKNYTDSNYEKAVLSKEDFDRTQVTSKNIARLLTEATEKLKIKNLNTKVELIEIDLKNIEKSKKQFFEYLAKNEKSSNDFILLSAIMQGRLTGDPEGGAHVVVVGAYDAQKKSVLILDSDREWYEPYWSPQDKVFEAISDPKADGIHPSYIYFKVR